MYIFILIHIYNRNEKESEIIKLKQQLESTKTELQSVQNELLKYLLFYYDLFLEQNMKEIRIMILYTI